MWLGDGPGERRRGMALGLFMCARVRVRVFFLCLVTSYDLLYIPFVLILFDEANSYMTMNGMASCGRMVSQQYLIACPSKFLDPESKKFSSQHIPSLVNYTYRLFPAEFPQQLIERFASRLHVRGLK
jgi:hypothetical protein